MRVLAIRGANLASLKGAFEVDLAAPPLAGAGLFAIAGPTGAGKSTLLDALCLALFDRIPRLLDARPVEIGRGGEDEAGRERGNDVRAILRRGSAAGFAEVDFVGQDGRRYRSRWSVRRARNHPRGALQPQTLVLTDLATGEAIGETRSDTLKEIELRLGLNLDQFRRAVLLAQGDFAAFLKANADERSNLLERITGLDIYSRLSIAAHERGNQEEQECRMIEQRLADTQPLGPEARKALEEEAEAVAAGVRRLESDAAALQWAQEWAERLAGLLAEEAQGRARLAEGRELQARSGPRRDYLKAVESVQPLRPMAHAAEQAGQERDEAARELELVHEKIKLSQSALGTAEEALRVAEQEREAAVRRRREATPQLNRARELDALLIQAATRAKDQQSRLNEPREALQGARTRLESLVAEQTAVGREITEVRDWLDARSAYLGLARDWGRWDAELKRYLRFSEGLREGHEAIKRNQIELERTQRHLRESGLQVERASREREVAEGDLRRLELERKGIDFDELRQRRKQEQLRRDRLKEAFDLHQRAVEAAQRLARLRAEAEALQGTIDQARQALVGLGEELKAREAARGEAQYAWKLAVAADNESAEAMRALLRDGDPCPVCGSLEHPWRGGHEARSRQVDALRTRLDELEETLRALGERRAQAEESQRQDERRLRQVREEEEQVHAEADRIETQWQALDCKERSPRPAVTEPTLRGVLRQALEDTQVVLAEISTREEQGHAITAQLERIRARHQELVREEQSHQDAHRGFEAELAQIQAQRQHLEGRYADQGRELEGVLEALGGAFQGITGWRHSLEQAPEAFVEQCERRIGEIQRQEARLDRLTQKGRDIEAAVLPLQVEVRALDEACQRQETVAAQACEHLDDLQGQRQSHFGGRPVTEIEAELDKAESLARKAVEAAQSGFHQRRTQAATDRQGLGHWEKELRRRELILDNARRRLDQALAERGLEATALTELIAHDLKWIQAESAELRGIDRQVGEAEALLRERETRRQRHQDAAPDLDLATLPVRQAEVGAEISQERHRWAELHGRIRVDDERRERGATLREELRARARRRELWAGLRELVGSHDGKKFRIFAQGLTLEILLGHANQHLRELTPRYWLERAPGHDLDIQVVDRDMGDEVRSVHSLSGGESFLASLALALGLASLAADTTRIDSLFIDEGFGSLDPDTLDVALSALDALQAQGRTVGVISHVPALVERIGVQVRVEREGGGRSRVVVQGPHVLAI